MIERRFLARWLRLNLLQFIGLSMISLGILLFVGLEKHNRNKPPTPSSTPTQYRENRKTKRKQQAFRSFEAKVRLEESMAWQRHFENVQRRLNTSAWTISGLGAVSFLIGLKRRM